MITHTIKVNSREDGRFELVVDGRVVRCTYDAAEIEDRVRALAGQSVDPDKRDRMLGEAIGRSH